jgi:hypothetical protein
VIPWYNEFITQAGVFGDDEMSGSQVEPTFNITTMRKKIDELGTDRDRLVAATKTIFKQLAARMGYQDTNALIVRLNTFIDDYYCACQKKEEEKNQWLDSLKSLFCHPDNAIFKQDSEVWRHFIALVTSPNILNNASETSEKSVILAQLSIRIAPLTFEKGHLDAYFKNKNKLFTSPLEYRNTMAVKKRLDAFLNEYDEACKKYDTNENFDELKKTLANLFRHKENAIFKKHSGVWGCFLDLLDWVSYKVFYSKKFSTDLQATFDKVEERFETLDSLKKNVFK